MNEFYLIFTTTTLFFIIAMIRRSVLPTILSVILSILTTFYAVIVYQDKVEAYLFAGIGLLYAINSVILFWYDVWKVEETGGM